jgi:hypothetical protein
MAKTAKKAHKKAVAKPVDLSEYAEEAVPFEAVIKRLMQAPPQHRSAPQPKATKRK